MSNKDVSSMTKAELNAWVGRLYYNALTDAAGYPNGYAYWEDMSPTHKYHETQTALQFVDMLVQEGLITLNHPMGTGNSQWGEGECKDLFDQFESTHEAEKAELEARIKHFNLVMTEVKDEVTGEQEPQ